MASLNKQQKRAKRAKAKAKQINIHGRKPAALDDELGHLDEPIPEYTLAMFSKMRDAEAISRNEMLLTLLRELAFVIVDHPVPAHVRRRGLAGDRRVRRSSGNCFWRDRRDVCQGPANERARHQQHDSV